LEIAIVVILALVAAIAYLWITKNDPLEELAKANFEIVKHLRLAKINAEKLTRMEAKVTEVALADAQKILQLTVLVESLERSAVDLAKEHEHDYNKRQQQIIKLSNQLSAYKNPSLLPTPAASANFKNEHDPTRAKLERTPSLSDQPNINNRHPGDPISDHQLPTLVELTKEQMLAKRSNDDIKKINERKRQRHQLWLKAETENEKDREQKLLIRERELRKKRIAKKRLTKPSYVSPQEIKTARKLEEKVILENQELRKENLKRDRDAKAGLMRRHEFAVKYPYTKSTLKELYAPSLPYHRDCSAPYSQCGCPCPQNFETEYRSALREYQRQLKQRNAEQQQLSIYDLFKNLSAEKQQQLLDLNLKENEIKTWAESFNHTKTQVVRDSSMGVDSQVNLSNSSHAHAVSMKDQLARLTGNILRPAVSAKSDLPTDYFERRDTGRELSCSDVMDLTSRLSARPDKIIMSHHALDRSYERGIELSQVITILERGTITEGPTREFNGDWKVSIEGRAGGTYIGTVIAIVLEEDSGDDYIVVCTVKN